MKKKEIYFIAVLLGVMSICGCNNNSGNKNDTRVGSQNNSNQNSYENLNPFCGKFYLSEIQATTKSENRSFYIEKNNNTWYELANGLDISAYLTKNKLEKNNNNIEKASTELKKEFSEADQNNLKKYFFINTIENETLVSKLYFGDSELSTLKANCMNLNINDENLLLGFGNIQLSKLENTNLNISTGKDYKASISKKGMLVYFTNSIGDYVLFFKNSN